MAPSPTGPFRDATGKALITNEMTTDMKHSWDDLDPTVFIDDDGQAYLFWGNGSCKYTKLKENMIELDGPSPLLNRLIIRRHHGYISVTACITWYMQQGCLKP